MSTPAGKAAFYRMIWRWHFYAGLFVVPMVLVLSLTGAAYLFKPQIERWEERSFEHLEVTGRVGPDAQVQAALAIYPRGRFQYYRIPRADDDAALVHLSLPDEGNAMRDVFVSPQGKVLGSLDPETRIMQVVHDIHGQLLLGHRGSWIVELAASWAIVMILTGLTLWWPKGRGLAGTVWPRLSRGSGTAWRDMHAVTGFWVSGLAMVLLLTGLPWADVWGSAFKAVRGEMGWVKGAQDWTIGGRAPDVGAASGEHAGHDHAAMAAIRSDAQVHAGHGRAPVPLGEIVALARGEHLPFPVIVTPPGAPGRFGAKGKAAAWTVRSDTPNRPLRVTLTYDAATARETSREVFADKHVIDRIVGYGVAWHEGQLFGLANQLIGAATALMLVTLSVSGFVLWRRRKPESGLGAPPVPAVPARIGGVAVIVLALAAFLPLLALSLAAILAIEALVIRRSARLSTWMGLR